MAEREASRREAVYEGFKVLLGLVTQAFSDQPFVHGLHRLHKSEVGLMWSRVDTGWRSDCPFKCHATEDRLASFCFELWGRLLIPTFDPEWPSYPIPENHARREFEPFRDYALRRTNNRSRIKSSSHDPPLLALTRAAGSIVIFSLRPNLLQNVQASCDPVVTIHEKLRDKENLDAESKYCMVERLP